MSYKNIPEIPIATPVSNYGMTTNENNIILCENISKETRHKFISRVYNIVFFQLICNCISILLFINIPALNNFIKSDIGTIINVTTLYLFLIINCMMICLYESFNKSPFKQIYLCLFTYCSSYILSSISIYYSTNSLLLAGVSTLLIVLGLSLYAYQTKYDFTTKGGILITALLSLIIFSIFSIFFEIPFYNVIYSSIGAFIFSVFIIYDTQLIIGGKHRKIQFRESDTILAATSLYIDILNLFLTILDLVNGR